MAKRDKEKRNDLVRDNWVDNTGKRMDPSFIKLQNEWYEKLKDEGFRDIEYVCPLTGRDHAMLKDTQVNLKKRIAVSGTEHVLTHYNMVQSFLTNYSNWFRLVEKKKENRHRLRFIMQRYVEGVSYRQICREYKSKFPDKKPFSTIVIFEYLRKLLPKIERWHKKQKDKELLELEARGSV